jgi:hypothetical protein
MIFISNLGRGALLCFLFVCLSASLTAQIIDLFQPATDKADDAFVSKELKEFGLLQIDAEDYSQLKGLAPEQFTLRLPATPGVTPELTLELQKNTLVRYDFRLITASGKGVITGVDLGTHYVGHIAGEPDSRVALSLLDEELTATITHAGGQRLALGRVKGQDTRKSAATYLLFPDAQLADRQEFDCSTADSNIPYPKEDLNYDFFEKTSAGCVDVYFEIDYDIFYDKGSVTAAAQHLAANFNEVKALYDGIGVNLRISEIKVWDIISPYAGTSSSSLLTQFQSNSDDFNGDVAQLVSYQASGGIAVLDGLCHPLRAARMSFSSIHSNFAAVPTYSWSTMVIAHELGHLLGSQHTHACVWNNNDTAIDGCAGFTEGFCGTPGVPADGGTIMSYCHLRSSGINFRFGFGPQPGAVIANRVRAAQGCVQAACDVEPPNDDGDNGDDDDDNNDGPTVCEQQSVIVRLILDDFGMETTWKIKTETGTVLAMGGPYPKKQKGRIIRDTVCVLDGCYVFEMADENGDGICCTYGNGRFTLSDLAGNIVVANEAFDTLTIGDFCLPLDGEEEDNDLDCDVIDFVEQPIITYGTNQDAGTVVLTDGNKGIRLANNAWKAIAIAIDYTMNEDTWVSFWFRSNSQGEIHGIGMDDNEVLSANFTFRLYGTQSWGLGDFDDYAGDGQWRFYQIPIGQYYALQAKYLFFTADHDVGVRSGVSEFLNVSLSEGTPCNSGALPATGELPASAYPTGAVITPNPASNQVNVQLPKLGQNANYEVVDLTGRPVLSGNVKGRQLQLKVAELPNGAYVFRYRNGNTKGSERFIVTH